MSKCDPLIYILLISANLKNGNSSISLSTKVPPIPLRLNSITESFLNLLQQLEKTISPFTEPQLIQHRVDYLRHIITVTLESDREKHIKNLQDELRRLKISIAQQISPILEKPLNHSKVMSRNSTCSRESEEIKDSFELQQKNTPLRQSKKSSIKF